MGEIVIITGDTITITTPDKTVPPNDALALYTLTPATPLLLTGSSPNFKVRGAPACWPTDVETLKTGFMYTSGSYVGGTGIVSLKLKDANKSQATKNSNEQIVINGGAFEAKFTITAPAMNPNAMPDPSRPVGSSKDGSASFTSPTKNNILRVG
ncbi:hypothetical protein ME763_36835 (plasmid) [Streptomyces murinus]|uniref:hypothetical protein n=1 Tax=Streptomyces murinus TaxID=33900 RepID=UPI00117DC039|nr:hypothetical protein [Streptomyces murinus]WDO11306.1 hypothetical protein ME763_36835 [Streptomyces murinus]